MDFVTYFTEVHVSLTSPSPVDQGNRKKITTHMQTPDKENLDNGVTEQVKSKQSALLYAYAL